MTILYIYRNPAMGFSIGKVFKPIEEEMKKYAEVDALYLPVPNYKPFGLWCNIRAARRAAKAKQYDIIHITGAEHYLIPFLKGQKVVVTVHDLGFCTILKHKLSYLIKFLMFVTSLKKASLVTFISTKTQKETIGIINIRNHCVVSNPIGKEFIYMQKKFNKECPIVLHVGTKDNKNLDRSITAINGLTCKLRIIGKINTEQEKRLNKLNIDFSNGEKLSDGELLQEYQKADIINFPSLYEGFGMPIIEGQSTGRIVVTSAKEPMIGIAGKNGAILVNPESVDSIHNAYLKAINEDEERNEIISNGLENVKRFNLNDITRQYFDKYSELLSL